MDDRDAATLLDRARDGDRAALARLLTRVEKGGDAAAEIGRLTFDISRGGYTIGITGSPGAGKSTLTSALVSTIRGEGRRVAVLAVDPTSPYSGGAILGDRVRMGDHALDEDVFIRSMATRGHLGGLALSTPQAVRVLDAVGFDDIVVETVGVGQVEVEVAGATDTTVVVVNPGWGDAVQANKAGLMEVADLFVINKADRPGTEDTRRDLEQMLDLAASDDWRPPIIETVATTGSGTADLWDAVQGHRRHLEASGELERRRRLRVEVETERILGERLRERARGLLAGSETGAEVADPWTAADRALGSGTDA